MLPSISIPPAYNSRSLLLTCNDFPFPNIVSSISAANKESHPEPTKPSTCLSTVRAAHLQPRGFDQLWPMKLLGAAGPPSTRGFTEKHKLTIHRQTFPP